MTERSYRSLHYALGDQFYFAFQRAARLIDSPSSKAGLVPSDRARLHSLRLWLGPEMWAVLNSTVDTALLSSSKTSDHDRGKAICKARDAIGMVIDWEQECERWGL